jgi:hypothetical protein
MRASKGGIDLKIYKTVLCRIGLLVRNSLASAPISRFTNLKTRPTLRGHPTLLISLALTNTGETAIRVGPVLLVLKVERRA